MEFQLQNELVCPEESCGGSIVIGAPAAPLVLVRNERAKRYILRVLPDGTVRLTIPRRGSERMAREFAGRNGEWLKQQLRRVAARQAEQNGAWDVGSEILFRGDATRIEAEPAGGPGRVICLADQRIHLREAGASVDLRRAIESHLRRMAAAELPPRVWALAAAHGVAVKRVTVRNQRSRWGSCSRHGTISLNWRLVQAPAHVSEYIILHELMHVRQMNHSPRFWREVEQVCPGFREAEKWLRANSTLLRR